MTDAAVEPVKVCLTQDCGRQDVVAKGKCGRCYQRGRMARSVSDGAPKCLECPEAAKSRGRCMRHYQRWRLGREPGLDGVQRCTSTEEGKRCPNREYAKAKCAGHYQREVKAKRRAKVWAELGCWVKVGGKRCGLVVVRKGRCGVHHAQAAARRQARLRKQARAEKARDAAGSGLKEVIASEAKNGVSLVPGAGADRREIEAFSPT